jgi:hypothetical protein
VLKNLLVLLILISSTSVLALPIDWNGSFSLDTIRIDNYRLSGTGATGNAGSQEITTGDGAGPNALFQSYTLKLKPHLIINDGVSVKGIFSTGTIQGEQFGDNTQFSSNNSAAGLHYHGSAAGTSALDVSQLFVELFADSALYRVGRFSRQWGLGAVANAGNNPTDRFFSLYDGIEAEYNFGKFFVTPFWTKQSTGNSLTRNTAITEMGVQLLYDNPDKDLKIGALYTNRTSGGANTALKAANTDNATPTTPHDIGSSSYKLFDIYMEKSIGDFTIKAELPFVSGTAGNVYDTTTKSNYKSSAMLFDVTYRKSNTTTYGLLAGSVSGDDGSTDEFEAMFLNPNFQIAHMMFRYDLNAVGANSTKNVYASYITNTMFVKLYADVIRDNWTWKFAYIIATANEVAATGRDFYYHEGKYKVTSAAADQSDDYGHELDIAFDYQWNPNVVVTGFIGYMLTGDYYKFTNSPTEQETKNSYTSGMKMSVSF